MKSVSSNIYKPGQKGSHATEIDPPFPSQRKKKPRKPGGSMTPIGMSIPDPYVQALLLMYPGLSPRLAARKFIMEHLKPYEGEENE